MVPQLKIHVNGSASVFRTAERGVLHIEVSSTTSSQAESSSNVSSITETIINTFRQFAPKTEDGLLLRVRPGDVNLCPQGKERPGAQDLAPKQYTTTTTAEVIFRDMGLLARLANELSAMENVSITQTEWRLTDATHAAICRDARVGAMRDAVQKAEDYAGVVGREVVAVRVEDGPANVSHSGRTQQTARRLQQQHAPMAQAPPQAWSSQATTSTEQGVTISGPSLEPSTITVSARVDVNFVSKDGEPIDDSE